MRRADTRRLAARAVLARGRLVATTMAVRPGVIRPGANPALVEVVFMAGELAVAVGGAGTGSR